MVYLNIEVNNKCVAEIGTKEINFALGQVAININPKSHHTALVLASQLPKSAYFANKKILYVPDCQVRYLSNSEIEDKEFIRLIK